MTIASWASERRIKKPRQSRQKSEGETEIEVPKKPVVDRVREESARIASLEERMGW